MPLQFTYITTGDDEPALALPYRAEERIGRRNHGFFDLRGDPERARSIAEAASSPAFQDLLAQLADSHSRYFSVGCELGDGPVTLEGGAAGHCSGGYVQIAHNELHSPAALHNGPQGVLARDMRAFLDGVVGDRLWAVRFIVTVIGVEALGGPEQVWSPLIEMDAIAENAEHAAQSAEQLFVALGEFFRQV